VLEVEEAAILPGTVSRAMRCKRERKGESRLPLSYPSAASRHSFPKTTQPPTCKQVGG